ncbi:hypothetical protein PUN28_018883 [Cardiocondyla obscurior]|uniref:Uncharacterized protein n=1 Tax=Cardiocondyla obscurior TaxID=286306 RepID=A0AAW2EHW2_9HYME
MSERSRAQPSYLDADADAFCRDYQLVNSLRARNERDQKRHEEIKEIPRSFNNATSREPNKIDVLLKCKVETSRLRSNLARHKYQYIKFPRGE